MFPGGQQDSRGDRGVWFEWGSSENLSEVFRSTRHIILRTHTHSTHTQVLGLQQCKQKMRAVIDVGAAPGSWTSYLATAAQCVYFCLCVLFRVYCSAYL